MIKDGASLRCADDAAPVRLLQQQVQQGSVLVQQASYRKRSFPRHSHDYFGFALIDRGVEAYYARGENHLVPSGGVVLLNAGDAHTGGNHDDAVWSYRMLILDPDVLADLASESGGGPVFPLFRQAVLDDQPVRRQLDQVMQAVSDGSNLLEERLLCFAANVTRRFGGLAGQDDCIVEVSRDSAGLSRIRDFLVAEPFRHVALSDLSSMSGLSRTYIVTAFRKQFGLPPMAFQLQLRLAGARRAVLAGEAPLSEIALETGFYDQSDLTRHFTRVFGMSPARMRRAYSRSRSASA